MCVCPWTDGWFQMGRKDQLGRYTRAAYHHPHSSAQSTLIVTHDHKLAHQNQVDSKFHSKLQELSKAFLLAERALPVLPVPKRKKAEGEEKAAPTKQEEEEGEVEEEGGEKTVKFIGPGA